MSEATLKSKAKIKVAPAKDELKLSRDELEQCSKLYYEGQLRLQAIQIVELEQQKAKTQLELLSAQYTLKNKELSELVRTVNGKRKEHQEQEAGTAKFFDAIRERLKLPEGWGFDPDTGTIKLGKKE